MRRHSLVVSSVLVVAELDQIQLKLDEKRIDRIRSAGCSPSGCPVVQLESPACAQQRDGVFGPPDVLDLQQDLAHKWLSLWFESGPLLVTG